MPSNRRTKDREAEHQRWADRQEVTADVLRETVEAAGARAAEISEWLDSSFMPEDPESVFGATPKAEQRAPQSLADKINVATDAPVERASSTAPLERLPSATEP